jgi:hypothetical protein
MPNSNHTCASGDEWPVARRASMNCCISSREIRSLSMRRSISAGVNDE